MAKAAICSVSDCGKPTKASGLCGAHYKRKNRYGDPTKGRIPQGEAFRYLTEIVLNFDRKECLTWPYGRDSSGYGRVWIGDKAENVCRVVCTEEFGPPSSPDLQAAHSCGKGHLGCVSKRHLSWKTPAENSADRTAHGTVYRGGNKPIFHLNIKVPSNG